MVEPTPSDVSGSRQPWRAWLGGIALVLAIYLAVAVGWAGMFFRGSVPGPYWLLLAADQSVWYVGTGLLLLIAVPFAISALLRLIRRRAEGRRMALRAVGAFALVALVCGAGTTTLWAQHLGEAEIGGRSYMLAKYNPGDGFARLALIECPPPALACQVVHTEWIKAHETGRLELHAESETLRVMVCSRMWEGCIEDYTLAP